MRGRPCRVVAPWPGAAHDVAGVVKHTSPGRRQEANGAEGAPPCTRKAEEPAVARGAGRVCYGRRGEQRADAQPCRGRASLARWWQPAPGPRGRGDLG